MKIRIEGGSDGVVTGMELTVGHGDACDMAAAVRAISRYSAIPVEDLVAQIFYNAEFRLRRMASQIGDEQLSSLDCAVRSEINCRDIARRKSEQSVVESTEKTD